MLFYTPSRGPFSFLLTSSCDLLNPINSPMTPLGFGTGHSRSLLALAAVVPLVWAAILSKSSLELSNWAIPSFTTAGSGLLRRRRFVPSAAFSESAYATRGAGQGSACGRATTKKHTATVVANSEDVIRDRGCRCGGMMRVCEEGRRGG